MTYIKALHRYAVIEVGDSEHSGHNEIAEDISCLLERNFKTFVIDFKHVSKFNSHILSLVAGLFRVIAKEDGKLFISKLLPVAVEAVRLCGLCVTTLQPEDLGQLTGMDEDSLREIHRITSL